MPIDVTKEGRQSMHVYDVMVVGAGPSGLAAAIAAKQCGLDYKVLEQGLLVNSIFHFPVNMRFFTTPELLEIGGLPFVTPYDKPTRQEALRYYRRVTDSYQLDIELGESVVDLKSPEATSRKEFTVETQSEGKGKRQFYSRTVVLALGCYDYPNRLSIPGEDLPHVSHYYSEPHAYYRKQVIVVGGKNSAAEAALELFRAGARVTLVHRRGELGQSIKYWVRPDILNRITEGSITGCFEAQVVEIRVGEIVIETQGKLHTLPADAVFLLTGYRTDTSLMSQAGVRIAPDTYIPEHDPATFETNVDGLYIIGTAITGIHSGRIFIENGRFHGQVAIKQILKRFNRKKN
ncbi:uncharacterized protein METZ01_LOCUS47633 [marine metagenome]|uniref:FAD/NAD(P)-binding domain-containing protein n=1 Tax=marine metagenome TaxID=408172 RepID=A0A381RUM6_9ZZZZ